MPDRLLVGVLGNPNAGKTKTWTTLFGRYVQTGKYPRPLELRPNECVEVFLVSGSFEERHKYAGDVLGNQDCRIVLCSMQYIEGVHDTLDYLIENDFFLYVQWLNPGYEDANHRYEDRLGLVDKILSVPSVVSARDGKVDSEPRVQEIREFIHGWALYRNLIKPC